MNKIINFAASCITILCLGCDHSPPPQATDTDAQRLLKAVEQELATRADRPKDPTTPAFEHPSVPGWTKSALRPLPKEERGFSVAYNHESGTTVTLYQFKRGYERIPDDLQSKIVRQEMTDAKLGISEAVKLGMFWDSAEEQESGIAALGDSQRQALQTRFIIGKNGEQANSEIYVWSYADTLLKIRATVHAGEDPMPLKELLTAIGNACEKKTD